MGRAFLIVHVLLKGKNRATDWIQTIKQAGDYIRTFIYSCCKYRGLFEDSTCFSDGSSKKICNQS